MKQKNLSKSISFIGGGHRFTLPKCDICKHFIVDNDPTKYSCKAFPNGIPDGIIWEDEEKECNNGIKFEEE